jgi:heme-degrading monooxygenase HmoA
MDRLSQMKSEVQAADGYQGVVSLLSMSNPDRITNITFWDSEEALKASISTTLKHATELLSDIIDGPPQVANQEVGIFDMAKITTRA